MYNTLQITSTRLKYTNVVVNCLKKDVYNICHYRYNTNRLRTFSRCLSSVSNIVSNTSVGIYANSSYRNSDKLSVFLNKRYFSTQKSGSDGEDDPSKATSETQPEAEYPVHQALPATVVVPEVWPHLPLIAVNRNPVFPRFIKLIEVSFISI